MLQFEKRLGVAESNLATIALRHRHRLDEFSALRVVLVRIVIREEDAIGPIVRIVQWSAWVLKFPLVVTQIFSAR
jgi:hypothetical protein